jgi:hypothetical protein
MQKNISLFIGMILFVSLFYSCAATSSVMVKVIKPADINVPGHVKKLGIVDRTYFFGESAYQDKYSANETMAGAIVELSKTERFTVYQIQGVSLSSNGSNSFSSPLNWNEVKDLCDKNKVDALVVLEIFTVNKNISWSTENQSIVKNGITQNQIMHIANMRTEVLTGWRIYDPANQTIVDQWRISDSKFSSAKGISTFDAESALPQYSFVVTELARNNGEKYALRIAPVAMMVNRYFYTGGDPQLQDAQALINAQNYKEAVKVWEAVFRTSQKPKIQGRAAHNIAVACEINGELDKAIEWAQKAIGLGSMISKSYVQTLQQRKMDDEKAKEQLESVEEEK